MKKSTPLLILLLFVSCSQVQYGFEFNSLFGSTTFFTNFYSPKALFFGFFSYIRNNFFPVTKDELQKHTIDTNAFCFKQSEDQKNAYLEKGSDLEGQIESLTGMNRNADAQIAELGGRFKKNSESLKKRISLLNSSLMETGADLERKINEEYRKTQLKLQEQQNNWLGRINEGKNTLIGEYTSCIDLLTHNTRLHDREKYKKLTELEDENKKFQEKMYEKFDFFGKNITGVQDSQGQMQLGVQTFSRALESERERREEQNKQNALRMVKLQTAFDSFFSDYQAVNSCVTKLVDRHKKIESEISELHDNAKILHRKICEHAKLFEKPETEIMD